MHPPDFRELVRRAQAGDAAAIEALIQGTLPDVERLVRASAPPVGPGESISDRLHNTWLRVLEKLGQFEGARAAADDGQARASFFAWVQTIARHLALNAARGAATRGVSLQLSPDDSTAPGAGFDPPAPGPSPSANVRADERTRLVLEVLQKLPEAGDREIVRLRFFEGLSLRRISEELGVSYDKVRERYRISMRRLRRDLEGLQ